MFCAIPKQVELTEEPIDGDVITCNDFIADSCVDLTGCDKFSSDKSGSARDAVNLVELSDSDDEVLVYDDDEVYDLTGTDDEDEIDSDGDVDLSQYHSLWTTNIVDEDTPNQIPQSKRRHQGTGASQSSVDRDIRRRKELKMSADSSSKLINYFSPLVNGNDDDGDNDNGHDEIIGNDRADEESDDDDGDDLFQNLYDSDGVYIDKLVSQWKDVHTVKSAVEFLYTFIKERPSVSDLRSINSQTYNNYLLFYHYFSAILKGVSKTEASVSCVNRIFLKTGGRSMRSRALIKDGYHFLKYGTLIQDKRGLHAKGSKASKINFKIKSSIIQDVKGKVSIFLASSESLCRFPDR